MKWESMMQQVEELNVAEFIQVRAATCVAMAFRAWAACRSLGVSSLQLGQQHLQPGRVHHSVKGALACACWAGQREGQHTCAGAPGDPQGMQAWHRHHSSTPQHPPPPPCEKLTVSMTCTTRLSALSPSPANTSGIRTVAGLPPVGTKVTLPSTTSTCGRVGRG